MAEDTLRVAEVDENGKLGDAQLPARLAVAALAATIGAQAALEMANPETSLADETDKRIAAIIGSATDIPHRLFIDDATSTPRPDVPGPVEWLTTVDVMPANIRLTAPAGVQPDSWSYVEVEAVPWLPLADSGLKMFYDVRNLGAADGTGVPVYLDHSPSARSMPAGTGAGQSGNPVYSAASLGGTPGLTFTNGGGLYTTYVVSGISIPASAHLVAGANVQFIAAGANSRTLFTFGGGTNGNCSVFKTTTGAWGVSIDATTAYTGGVADTAPHSILLHVTATRVTLYVDGAVVIDQEIAYTPGAKTSFRLGFVASSTNAATLRPIAGGVVGDVIVVAGDTAPDVPGMLGFLAVRRGA